MKSSIDIKGMNCKSCVMLIKDALEDVKGVSSANVVIGHADVEHTDEASVDDLKKAIRAEGFEV